MKRNWVDLGEVMSGRDLFEGERVTMNVFDKALNTLLEQIDFRAGRLQTGQYVWPADFCRHINTHSALIRAGVETGSGEWEVLESSYKNRYRRLCTREVVVVSTFPAKDNWTTAKCTLLHSARTLASTTVVRVNVRTAGGQLLESITFSPAANRLTPGLWTKDLAIHINASSRFVRAGRGNNHHVQPWHEGTANAIWMPFNSDFTVTWTFDELKDAGTILADRDAQDGERVSLFVFDGIADTLLDRITLTARADKKRLRKDQWPADLARQINASSGHAKAGARSGSTFTPKDSASENVLCQNHAQLRTFTTALHLDNWEQGDTLLARANLTAAERIMVNVVTKGKGNFCEELTFTPDPDRLKAAQWAHDLAVHINRHSLYLKAGVKNNTSKLIEPQENTTTNLIWLPKGSELRVSWDKTELKELGYLSLERELKLNEACRAYVLDDSSEEILRDIAFSATQGRLTKGYAAKDLAQRINGQTQMVAAGEKKNNERPAPVASGYLNTLWGCAKNIRAFTTLMSLKNWDKGEMIGIRDLCEDEQVSVVVKGRKTGRIFQSLVFTPRPGRLTKGLWSKDFCQQVNGRSRFIRAGQENTTLCLVEPMHKGEVNFFWTPKGSGLEVEWQIVSGIPQDLPGMTREAKQLFEQYAQAKKCISVDVKTGKPTLLIPVAELFGDDSLKNPLKVGLSHDAHLGVLLQVGGEVQRHARKTLSEQQQHSLALRDGRLIKVDVNMKEMNGGDFKVAPIQELIGDSPLTQVPGTVGFTVIYKDGSEDTFDFEQCVYNQGVVEVVRLTQHKFSSGKLLKLIYGESGQLQKICRGEESVLEASWFESDKPLPGSLLFEYTLKSLVLFPGSSVEKRTYSFVKKGSGDLQAKFTVDGFATSGKTGYIVNQDSSRRLTGIEIEQQHDFTDNKTTVTDKALYRETLAYTVDGKVDRHAIMPGGGIDDLIYDYTYAGDTTRLTGYYRTATPRTGFVRNYRLAAGQAYFEEYGSDAVPISQEKSHRLDTANKCLVSQTREWEGEVVVDEQSLTVDATGNPIARTENEKRTYYTYYNNYQQFNVTETAVKVEDWSLFGCLFKGLDYANPVGAVFAIGGKGGMTWGTRIDTKVEMSPASNDYAKKAFNLPVAIKHCGSGRPLSSDVESELLCRKVDGQEVAQRLTFFGYDNIGGRVVAKHKLVILQPDYIRVNVVAEQLAVATAAAKPFIDSLDKQIKGASGAEKAAFQKTLAELNESLDAQSKVNGEGFKLRSWTKGAMSLETFEYHTDAAKPGFGTVKSVETVQLDDQGNALEPSRRKTAFAYTVDASDASRLTITTTLSGKDQTDIVSSQTRSRNTGRLYENVDTEGVKTVYTYDPQGNLKSEKVSKNGTTQRETTSKRIRQLRIQYDMVEDGSTTRVECDALGRKEVIWLKPAGASAFIKTQAWSYDPLGRVASSTETDYGKANAKVSQRHTSLAYDDLTGSITSTHMLKDAAGKETHKVTQVRTPSLKGERFTQGTFTLDRQFNTEKSTFNERYTTTGQGGCRIERSLSADGLVTKVRYLKTDKAGKETVHDQTDFAYDQHGRLSKAAPKLGGESTYTYDNAGRLTSTTREGVSLLNAYYPGNPAPVAGESHVKRGDTTTLLGRQSVDMLGRVIKRTVNGEDTGFSYSGASTVAAFKSPGSAPPVLSGCTSAVDKASRTHTQKLGTGTSTLVFSTAGRVLTFTDLTGLTTTYTYDVFGRVIGSSNDQCVCTFAYADNGLPSSESIKAVKANLTMNVAYGYDELGQEVTRTFTCDGVDTLTLERTLLADGRLSKSTLKSAKSGKEVNSDRYEYDNCLRLSKWTGSDSRSDTFIYDVLGNLTNHVDPGSGKRQLFHYEASKPGQVSHVYEQAANLALPASPGGTAKSHDSSGRLTVDGERRLSYHGNGQVNTGSLDGDKNTYTFSYDGEGRVRGGSIGTKTDTYHYRGESVYALVQSDTGKNDGFAKRTLVLRNESRACLMQNAITDDKDSSSFELRDAHGTVFASVDLGARTITYYRYEPYGKRYSGTRPQNWLGFKGEPLNRLGLYHLGNGYRLYDPNWGRFLSRDSRSPFGVGGAAAYVFCNGDPVNNADPNGRQVIAQYSRWGSGPAIHSTAFRIVVGAVSVLLAPFTAGTSMLLAVATTALAAIAFAFDMASLIIAESDPQLSRTLEAWGQVFGLASGAAGISMTLHGIRGVPRSWFKVRGGPSVSTPVKWPKTTSELRFAQQARAKAITRLVDEMDKAKAAGTYDAFKAACLAPEGGIASGVTSIPPGGRFTQRASASAKDLFKGIIREFDDSLFDYLGTTLDLHSGPNMLVQKFIPPMSSETEVVSLVAGPMPGREQLFP